MGRALVSTEILQLVRAYHAWRRIWSERIPDTQRCVAGNPYGSIIIRCIVLLDIAVIMVSWISGGKTLRDLVWIADLSRLYSPSTGNVGALRYSSNQKVMHKKLRHGAKRMSLQTWGKPQKMRAFVQKRSTDEKYPARVTSGISFAAEQTMCA